MLPAGQKEGGPGWGQQRPEAQRKPAGQGRKPQDWAKGEEPSGQVVPAEEPGVGPGVVGPARLGGTPAQ